MDKREDNFFEVINYLGLQQNMNLAHNHSAEKEAMSSLRTGGNLKSPPGLWTARVKVKAKVISWGLRKGPHAPEGAGICQRQVPTLWPARWAKPPQPGYH